MSKGKTYLAKHTTFIGGQAFEAKSTFTEADLPEDSEESLESALASGSIEVLIAKKPGEEETKTGTQTAAPETPAGAQTGANPESLTLLAGIGNAGAKKLNALGITTQTELRAKIGDEAVKKAIGANYETAKAALAS